MFRKCSALASIYGKNDDSNPRLNFFISVIVFCIFRSDQITRFGLAWLILMLTYHLYMAFFRTDCRSHKQRQCIAPKDKLSKLLQCACKIEFKIIMNIALYIYPKTHFA
jgi:hypothetical protein